MLAARRKAYFGMIPEDLPNIKPGLKALGPLEIVYLLVLRAIARIRPSGEVLDD